MTTRSQRVRRGMMVVLGTVSVLQVTVYGMGLEGVTEWVGLTLGVAGVAAATYAWRTDAPRAGWVLGLVGLAGAVVFALFLVRAPLPFPNRPLLVLALAAYLALAILLPGLIIPKVDPGRVILIAVSVAGGALLVEAVASRRVSVYARTPGTLAQAMVDPGYAVGYRGSQEQHPEIGPIPVPNSVTEKLYPDNPRGYFRTRNSSWLLSNQPSSFSRLDPTADDVAVIIDRADDPTPWHIQLSYNGLALSGGTDYTLRFRIRATQERGYAFAVGMAHEPWESLGLYESDSVGPDWETVERAFTATESDENVRVHVDLGGDTADVHLADLTLAPSSGDAPLESSLGSEYYVSYEWNSRGCRAPEYPIAAEPNTFRIVALGDSFTQGTGVHIEDVFTSVLERLLRERASQAPDPQRIEVLGCGMEGFSTREERVYYEERARDYQPDLVVLVMVADDTRSYRDQVELGYAHSPAKWEYLLRSGFLFQRSRHAAPPPDFSASLRELDRLAEAVREDGGQLAVVVFRNDIGFPWDLLAERADSVAAALDLPMLDLDGALVTGDYRTELAVHALDGHPNQRAHRIAAEMIAEWIEREGLVTPLPVDVEER